MARHCENRRTGIEDGGYTASLWGGPKAIVRKLLENEDIRILIENTDAGFDIYTGNDDNIESVCYWLNKRTCDPATRILVCEIHRLRDTIRKKRKREGSADEITEKKESNRVKSQLARARFYGNEATLTADEWRKIRFEFQGECAYCGSNKQMCMDHIVPILRGGGTTKLNVVTCCRTCNSSKNSRDAAWLVGQSAVDAILSRLNGIDHDL